MRVETLVPVISLNPAAGVPGTGIAEYAAHGFAHAAALTDIAGAGAPVTPLGFEL
jgi:hypothetical protein